MAIKKRTVPSTREDEIEAFGAAAETAGQAPAPASRPVPGEKGKVKTVLVRLESHEHQLLQDAANLEGRSMHNMLKTILIPGLEAVKEAHKE